MQRKSKRSDGNINALLATFADAAMFSRHTQQISLHAQYTVYTSALRVKVKVVHINSLNVPAVY